MNRPGVTRHDANIAAAQPAQPQADVRSPAAVASFHEQCGALFAAHHERLFRYLDRLSGDAELAADLVQDAFVRLYRRASLPDRPEAWLITVALNQFRNARSRHARRQRLLTVARAEAAQSDPPIAAPLRTHAEDTRRHIRAALDRLPERERSLLLLQAEGYAYRDIAASLHLNEASIGTLLARARAAFRIAYGEPDASR